jgi:hypothetical protein
MARLTAEPGRRQPAVQQVVLDGVIRRQQGREDGGQDKDSVSIRVTRKRRESAVPVREVFVSAVTMSSL